jgi:hypothetical protein
MQASEICVSFQNALMIAHIKQKKNSELRRRRRRDGSLVSGTTFIPGD